LDRDLICEPAAGRPGGWLRQSEFVRRASAEVDHASIGHLVEPVHCQRPSLAAIPVTFVVSRRIMLPKAGKATAEADKAGIA
jgi:hypothetical protein